MRMRRLSRSNAVTDPRSLAGTSAPLPEEPLPKELEARIAALERADPREDFDLTSWVWMLLFGIALPAALAFLGWGL
jgi:hypothetical protein